MQSDLSAVKDKPRINGKDWYRLTPDEALSVFASTATGLSSQEAARRLAKDGPNELIEAKSISPFRIIGAQFKSIIIWVLIVAGAVSGFLGERVDAIAIFAIVVLNAIIGFYQEFKAEKSISALKKLTAPQASVKRDGQITLIPASNIVSGDVLVLNPGDLVAADARLLVTASLTCIESALTGESEAIAKSVAILEHSNIPLGDRRNMVFMGTSVATGTAQAVVVSTAMTTELGRIAGLIAEVGLEKRTPLEKKLESFGRVLVWATLGIVIMLFGLGLLRGTPLLELFMTSVSLAVAAVPEGLPAIVTVALALGVVRMSRRRALIRRLPAVETLGSTTVICTDKTGTLTVGEMTVRVLYVAGTRYLVTGDGYKPDGEVNLEGRKVDLSQIGPLREMATLLLACNNAHIVEENGAWRVIGDPTEGALLVAGRKIGGDRDAIEKNLPKQHENPFDSDRKLSSVIRRKSDGLLRVFVNGAPDVLLTRCTHVLTPMGIQAMSDEYQKTILAQNSMMAQQALRVLGSAYGDLDNHSSGDLTADAVERNLVFVGLSGMYDPPRQEARKAVATCLAAGIHVVMITGDHSQTAKAIAREIGIASDTDEAVTGVELDAMSDQTLKLRAAGITVYARVTAEHKLRIIRAWKANDAVVAMTGDGVNDAPAVKGADIGIAMGRSGTEVTRQAADMIVTDDNFASIVAAVEEGRGIFDNIRKTLQYLLAGNTGELLLMTGCVVTGFPAPLLPIHLLWINLVTDGLPALCLATDPIDPDVMAHDPRHRSERILNHRFLRTMLLTGFFTAGVAFAVYIVSLKTETIEMARTSVFTVLVFAELLRSFGARSETKQIWNIPFLTNINLAIVVAASFGLQVWSHHNVTLGRFLKSSSMPFADTFMLLALGAIPMFLLEIVKVIQRFRTEKSK